MERIKEALEKATSKRADQESERAVETKHTAFKPIESRRSTPSTLPSNANSVTLDRAHLEEHRVVAFDKNDPNCSYFDILRTRVLRAMDENAWNTLAITSPNAECGKTVTAVNLAMSMAQQPERTVILIDLDLRRPSIGSVLGLQKSRSMADYFWDLATIDDIIVNLERERLFVLPTHIGVQNAAEMLTSQKTTGLISELRSRFPEAILIFDLPPILSTDDAIAFLPLVDCCFLVVGAHKTQIADIEESEQRIKDCHSLGLVLNMVDEPFKKQANYRY